MSDVRVYRSHPPTEPDSQVLRWLTAAQVAEKLGVTEQTVRRWARAGSFPAPSSKQKCQGAALWAEWQIDRWTADQAIPRRAFWGVS